MYVLTSSPRDGIWGSTVSQRLVQVVIWVISIALGDDKHISLNRCHGHLLISNSAAQVCRVFDMYIHTAYEKITAPWYLICVIVPCLSEVPESLSLVYTCMWLPRVCVAHPFCGCISVMAWLFACCTNCLCLSHVHTAITIQFTSSVFAADYDPTIGERYNIIMVGCACMYTLCIFLCFFSISFTSISLFCNALCQWLFMHSTNPHITVIHVHVHDSTSV